MNTTLTLRPSIVSRVAVAVLALSLVAGCSNMTNQQQKVLSGAAIGSAGGAAIGAIAAGTPQGALIGAGIGAVTGGVVGNFWK